MSGGLGYEMPFGRDHPHARPPSGEVMSCDEIRFWMRTLMAEHGWGRCLLGRTLGFAHSRHLVTKLRRSWIYPAEQLRCSRQLARIIRGELVPDASAYKHVAVLVAHPKPLREATRMQYDLKSGRLRWISRLKAPPERTFAVPDCLQRAGGGGTR